MAEDAQLRAACFEALRALSLLHGDELPYFRKAPPPGVPGGLEQGFVFQGERVAFLNPNQGIFRARQQRGQAALSVMTSANSPYEDAATEEGFLYDYRRGALDIPDNRAIRAAYGAGVPMVYFVGTRPNFYRSIFPCFVTDRDDVMRRVLITPVSEPDADELESPADPIAKRYATRTTLQRLHQARFRGRVLPAYANRCTICSLKEPRLLDAAHIVADSAPAGRAEVSNGLSLCSIHHRAFDNDLVGVSPDYKVVVSRRLREEKDGPMLELLKGFHGSKIGIPRRKADRPDRERLAERFEAIDE